MAGWPGDAGSRVRRDNTVEMPLCFKKESSLRVQDADTDAVVAEEEEEEEEVDVVCWCVFFFRWDVLFCCYS